MTRALETTSHDTATEATAPARTDEEVDRPDRVFSYRELARLDEALTMSSRETGLFFTLYVGDLGKRTRSRAEELHALSKADPTDSVLIRRRRRPADARPRLRARRPVDDQLVRGR
jgi:hypothetical protein